MVGPEKEEEQEEATESVSNRAVAYRAPDEPPEAPLVIGFLIGWLPTWLILRARIWSMQRRVDAMERNRLASLPPDGPAGDEPEPVA